MADLLVVVAAGAAELRQRLESRRDQLEGRPEGLVAEALEIVARFSLQGEDPSYERRASEPLQHHDEDQASLKILKQKLVVNSEQL